MMPLKIKTGLVCQDLFILQPLTPTMPLKITLSGGMILWEPTDFGISVVDNLGNQVLDNDSRFDSIFC